MMSFGEENREMLRETFNLGHPIILLNSLLICSVKQTAYTTYIDLKHQSILLMKYNLEEVKVLDIHIDLQSSYLLLPENGIYYE